ncbi:hypothetical protein [Flavobacterium xanthum]|uniref:Uncharacterized protein n=1 Tax=Flavobacterium xanthum TaxID=69322 RepID=A0A1M7LMR4_9FLAO|nr:hypothetical protein [Flavobacterium xanthum]SHM79421.1 hypothetical protein SAMN05443669_10766 [Flavobacterium xanthum]
MKKKLVIIIIFFGFAKIQAQDRITVAIGSNSTFIETYNKNSWSDEFTLTEAYRLGPTNLKTLKEGVKTSLKWIDLNDTHNKTFQKEVCRFKTTEKESFKFHGYVDQFATEMVMIFNGEVDGTFKIEIKPYNSFLVFITFTDVEMLKGFKDLLDGKSANNEVDDIFKK